MDRVAISAPLKCYGLELDFKDERCRECPHQTGCKVHMGQRASDHKISTLTFKLTPAALDSSKLNDPELATLQQLYENCHRTVFDRGPADRLDNKPNANRKLEQAADEVSCSVRMFILANMVGHQAASPDRTFYATMLLGEAAIKRVERYRAVCYEKFATFDLTALNTLIDSNQLNSLDNRMLTSEVTAGIWIVGYRSRISGPYREKLYNAQETALDPHWLAVEDSYAKLILVPHRESPSGHPEIQRHRFNVSQTISVLKRHKTKARAVFEIRERNSQPAVKRVLEHYGFNPDEFVTKEREVTDMLKFWGQLALAIKDYHISRYLDGDMKALHKLKGF
jgi:hypothetical protein